MAVSRMSFTLPKKSQIPNHQLRCEHKDKDKYKLFLKNLTVTPARRFLFSFVTVEPLTKFNFGFPKIKSIATGFMF